MNLNNFTLEIGTVVITHFFFLSDSILFSGDNFN